MPPPFSKLIVSHKSGGWTQGVWKLIAITVSYPLPLWTGEGLPCGVSSATPRGKGEGDKMAPFHPPLHPVR